MRGVVLMAAIILASAAIISQLGRSRCDRSVVDVDSRDTFQIVTFLTDCGGKSVSTEVGFASPGHQAEAAETVFLLPGKDAVKKVDIEKLGSRIAITFPRGSHMISKRTDWNGTPIEYVEKAPSENAETDAVD